VPTLNLAPKEQYALILFISFSVNSLRIIHQKENKSQRQNAFSPIMKGGDTFERKSISAIAP
jgi:hypothetical protein